MNESGHELATLQLENSIGSVIEAYCTDPASPYRSVTYKTRLNLLSNSIQPKVMPRIDPRAAIPRIVTK